MNDTCDDCLFMGCDPGSCSCACHPSKEERLQKQNADLRKQLAEKEKQWERYKAADPKAKAAERAIEVEEAYRKAESLLAARDGELLALREIIKNEVTDYEHVRDCPFGDTPAGIPGESPRGCSQYCLDTMRTISSTTNSARKAAARIAATAKSVILNELTMRLHGMTDADKIVMVVSDWAKAERTKAERNG